MFKQIHFRNFISVQFLFSNKKVSFKNFVSAFYSAGFSEIFLSAYTRGSSSVTSLLLSNRKAVDTLREVFGYISIRGRWCGRYRSIIAWSIRIPTLQYKVQKVRLLQEKLSSSKIEMDDSLQWKQFQLLQPFQLASGSLPLLNITYETSLLSLERVYQYS